MIKEAIRGCDFSGDLLKDTENAEEHRRDILTIQIQDMGIRGFELLCYGGRGFLKITESKNDQHVGSVRCSPSFVDKTEFIVGFIATVGVSTAPAALFKEQ